MNAGKRIGAAAAIVLAGLFAALIFRRPQPAWPPGPPATTIIEPDHRLPKHQQNSPVEKEPSPSAAGPLPTSDRFVNQQTSSQSASTKKVASSSQGAARWQPPPRLSTQIPRVFQPQPGGDRAPTDISRTSSEPGRLPSYTRPSDDAVLSNTPADESPQRPLWRRHRIRDGDKLPDLARRYLGSAKRRLEIFEANRDVLQSADLLPIGVVLQIPPK